MNTTLNFVILDFQDGMGKWQLKKELLQAAKDIQLQKYGNQNLITKKLMFFH